MQKTPVHLEQIQLVGIKLRTNNKDEFNPDTAKIAGYVGKYFSEQIADKIPQRKNPGKTFSAFAEYESDHTGEYTYFIGEEVESIDDIPAGLSLLVIAPQNYIKFTTNSGPMPAVVIDAWQQIWQMDDLAEKRRYHVDFEVYDERAADPANTVLDVYILISR